MSYAIETEHLTKHYGQRIAVDRLDLAVPAGQVTGFVGPNGAGKTTTIRLLLGLSRPSSGHGSVLGRPLQHPAAYLPRVGALVDGPALYPQLSGRHNLEVLARLGGEGHVDEVLAAVGLDDRADDQVGRYSLGMRQRLAIAAALLSQPELLILDEPTNGLDPPGSIAIRALLRRLADGGTTVFVSSHQLAELEQVCDHVILLREGRLIHQGPLRALLAQQPANIVAVPDDTGQIPTLARVARHAGWEVEVGDDAVTVTSPEASAAALNRHAHDRGIVLGGLWRRPPTLEETFLALTADADTEEPS